MDDSSLSMEERLQKWREMKEIMMSKSAAKENASRSQILVKSQSDPNKRVLSDLNSKESRAKEAKKFPIYEDVQAPKADAVCQTEYKTFCEVSIQTDATEEVAFVDTWEPSVETQLRDALNETLLENEKLHERLDEAKKEKELIRHLESVSKEYRLLYQLAKEQLEDQERQLGQLSNDSQSEKIEVSLQSQSTQTESSFDVLVRKSNQAIKRTDAFAFSNDLLYQQMKENEAKYDEAIRELQEERDELRLRLEREAETWQTQSAGLLASLQEQMEAGLTKSVARCVELEQELEDERRRRQSDLDESNE